MKERTAAKIADLSWYGAFGYYFFAFLIAGALLGAAVGWIVGDPGDGAAIGLAVGLVCWLVLTVASFRQLRTYEGRRRREPNGEEGDRVHYRALRQSRVNRRPPDLRHCAANARFVRPGDSVTERIYEPLSGWSL